MRRGSTALVVITLLMGCQAEAPPGSDASVGGSVVANCNTPQPCPGPFCPNNAVGAPDSISVDIAGCLLQLIFTTGSVVPILGESDLIIHATGIGGLTRVEVSRDTKDYELAAWIGNPLPVHPEATPNCLAQMLSATKVTIDISSCTGLSPIQAVRLIHEPQISGTLLVDSVEAAAFQPHKLP